MKQKLLLTLPKFVVIKQRQKMQVRQRKDF